MKPKLEANNPQRPTGVAVHRVVRCEHCESERVPQYDIELACGAVAVKDWRDMAERLYKVLGLRKTEHRLRSAAYAYELLKESYDSHTAGRKPESEGMK